MVQNVVFDMSRLCMMPAGRHEFHPLMEVSLVTQAGSSWLLFAVPGCAPVSRTRTLLSKPLGVDQPAAST